MVWFINLLDGIQFYLTVADIIASLWSPEMIDGVGIAANIVKPRAKSPTARNVFSHRFTFTCIS